jgi:3',5'-cyclic AMP phosphodiesterase CpdA
MEKLLAANPNKWTIVTFHHTIYSMARDRDNKEVRDAFQPLFDKYHVDLVLQGHDHVYSRTFRLRGNRVVPDDQPGTVYVISVSGPKAYDVSMSHENLMAKAGTRVQLFQVLSVEEKRLSFVAYTVTGEVYDSFELKKE